ncbi:hypothetical protein AGMMS49959_04870 [Planctomycetales bacterium]|nr:hypothetical protein AGMMS49959_04870 [Planctomycetales bacterium]
MRGGGGGKYGDYLIFRDSFYHLIEHKNLYALYTDWGGYFLYTPTFALSFGVFSSLPDYLGLTAWNLLNAVSFLLAIYYLPHFTRLQKGVIILIAGQALMTAVQNNQSNALTAALLIFGYGCLEKNKPSAAALSIAAAAYIKLFGVVGFALFLLYPRFWRNCGYAAGWLVAFFLAPLLVIDWAHYQFLGRSYVQILLTEHGANYGISAMGWLHTWFGWEGDKKLFVLAGAAVFMSPFLKTGSYAAADFRRLLFAALLIWVVIFNHKGQSSMFIMPMTGVALWFMTVPKNWLNIAFLAAALLFSSWSSTDLFPRWFRREYLTKYAVKAVPVTLIWLKITVDLWRHKIGGKPPDRPTD